MDSIFGLILWLLILSIATDMLFGGKLGLTSGIMGFVTQLFFQVFQGFLQFAAQIIGSLIQAVFQLAGKTLTLSARSTGWIANQGIKSSTSLFSRKKVLILGAGESLKPGIKYQELYDYSQTVDRTEIRYLAKGSEKEGDFWLGKHIRLKGSKSRKGEDVWIPNEYLHQHLLVVGETGSGKTELLLNSAENLMSKGNFVCVDAAGFLGNRLSKKVRKTGSKLVVWDISAKHNRIVWNFLEELEKYGRERDIRAIAEALYGKIQENDQNSAFWKRDIGWLTAILAIVVEARREDLVKLEPSDLSELIVDRDAVRALLQNLPQAASQWNSDLYSYLNLPEDRFGLDISFLQNKLSPFKDRDVKAICDGNSGIYLFPALNGKSRHTLIIGQNLADGQFGSALAAVMISYVMNIMYRRMKNPQHSWTPTYIVCDEAPRLKNIDYEELTAIGRNAKAGLILMCQSIDQFPQKVLPALNNCRSQIFLQGVSHQTANWLSDRLGKYTRREVNMNINQAVDGASPFNPSSISYKTVPVLGIREITDRPYSKLPSKRSAIVRVNAAQSPMTKPFITDYST